MRVCGFVLLLLLHPRYGLACTAPLSAQDVVSGAVSGVVHDLSGAVIAGAQIVLQNPATGVSLRTDTDRLGEFLMPALPPGTYRLQVEAAGFQLLQVESVAVELGRATRLAPTLAVGAVAQAVSVQALDSLPGFEAPVNADLLPEELQQLPLDGRRFQSLAPLTPLVDADDAPPADPADTNGAGNGSGSDDPAPDTDNVRLTVRGLDPQHNQYRLDGLSLRRAFDGEPRGGRSLPFTVAQEGVREFQVRAVGQGTGRGRDAGGSINTVSRRGGDGVHGSAFFLLRNSGVGASNPFAVSTRYNAGAPVPTLVKPRDIREQFGGSVGGPLLRSRLFGFASAEGQRRSFPGISSPSDPGFYNLSSIQTALLANRGVNAAATTRALTFLDSLTGPVNRRADELALFPRLDWQPGTRTSVTAEWGAGALPFARRAAQWAGGAAGAGQFRRPDHPFGQRAAECDHGAQHPLVGHRPCPVEPRWQLCRDTRTAVPGAADRPRRQRTRGVHCGCLCLRQRGWPGSAQTAG